MGNFLDLSAGGGCAHRGRSPAGQDLHPSMLGQPETSGVCRAPVMWANPAVLPPVEADKRGGL
ncbi:hypothetical protein AHIS1636_01800 [Arthrobacter mangrovi]|uniref:Uncharacterized protein n=1 Tax=Arthrobacter mangrovi TaxID=2966350 RepID=A0ABQ5MP16_9MICC|nr:hypothetical protein AHIS1636_01800 [Arthrobacter mangrovi]